MQNHSRHAPLYADVEDTLTPVLVDGPAHGTLVLNGDGSFTYTPDADYVGTDSFTYRASDGTAQSSVQRHDRCCVRGEKRDKTPFRPHAGLM